MLENVFVKLQSDKPVPADTKTVRQSTWIKIRAALFILNVSIFLKYNDYQIYDATLSRVGTTE